MGYIVLDRGENDRKVRRRFRAASSVQRLIGFAVGRTGLWDALMNWRANRTTREAPAPDIAGRSRAFVDLYQEWVRAA